MERGTGINRPGSASWRQAFSIVIAAIVVGNAVISRMDFSRRGALTAG